MEVGDSKRAVLGGLMHQVTGSNLYKYGGLSGDGGVLYRLTV